ncbi:Mov34/MPN/PAD-1 family protein [Thalassoroseus pseudoceratinae]|uniref:Mov34/MPN/PAD-1 family protein n=1 Tax=Thalassoroseus pseudoceratinae TaxID=2713176 RepID=UPI00141F2F91|nr:Mov34/MPN/PAD-1 family protein [Thalassoroseus pseudoceratinae]
MTDNSSPNRPDIHELTGEDLPRHEFPAGRSEPFRVHFADSAHESIWSHATENTTVEICGVLVGAIEHDDDGPFCRIAHAIRCDSATSKFAEVTFTHESWAEINRQMDADFTEFQIVGWYHTHPDFGIFLSDRDCFIHQNFFSGAGQVAHVVDPIRKTEGVFQWRNGTPEPISHFWIGDRIVADTHTESLAVGGPEQRRGSNSNSPQMASPQPAFSETPQKESLSEFWQPILVAVALFLLGFLVAEWRRPRLTAWEQQMIKAEVLRDYSIWKGMRPGLREKLEVLSRQLDEIENATRELSDDHTNALKGNDAKAVRKSWQTVLTALQKTRSATDDIANDYGLNASDTELLNRFLEAEAKLIERQKSEPTDEPKSLPTKKKPAEETSPKESSDES